MSKDDSDGDSMFNADSSSSSPLHSEPETKKQNEGALNGNYQNGSKAQLSGGVDPVLLEHAKSRLSKFAARLFDPNRRRGLVEEPATIPLNDEFLKAFGQREKKMDQLRGREEEIDHTIAEDDEDHGEKATTKNAKKAVDKDSQKRKVRISNLAYRTTEETLMKNCMTFGDLVEVDMVLDESKGGNDNKTYNSGLAYALFETEEGAKSCVEGLKTLDGRKLRVSLARARPKKTTQDYRAGGGSLLNQRTAKDISTICFRCGQVGHMESDCPNPQKKKPCNLCGMTDHDFRTCPKKQVCFNCGTPGHVSRDCPMRRGLPRRMVCGTCFQSGHHRLQCTLRGPHYSVTSSAICMDCGQRGHLLCKDLKWFYGLQGMTCFNCGEEGHSGYNCNRPNAYQCAANPEEGLKEIQRAESESLQQAMRKESEKRKEQEAKKRNEQERGRKKQAGANVKRKRSKSNGAKRKDKRGYR